MKKPSHIAEAETYSGDYTTIYYWAQRADGVWFVRHNQKTQWGYSCTAWRQSRQGPDRPTQAPTRSYRLPK